MKAMAMKATLIPIVLAVASGCDCGWTNNGKSCGVNDGSYCWAACCGHLPPSCSSPPWTVAYSPHRCHREGNNAIISCNARSGAECGTRLSSSVKVGRGSHAMRVKAAPGAGIATTFYLSTNGGLYDKTRTKPWVELDFEIFGRTAGAESRIWTNMLTGIAEEHWQWITVPFDVTADYHTYGFELDGESIAFTVDGVTYREVDISGHADVQAAISSSAFQEFISVWGRNSQEPPEGIPEFRAGLGLLDENANAFPVYAGYEPPLSPRQDVVLP